MKKALVLGGGGSKGAYEIGVWKALRECDWHFDLVCGTSIGALIGTMVVQDQYDECFALWNHIGVEDVIANGINLDFDMELLMAQKGKYKTILQSYVEHKGMDISPFEQMIDRLFDEDRFFHSPIDFACMSMNVTKMVPHAFTKGEMRCHVAPKDALLASAACFPAFPMRKINNENYIDGGYYDNVPIALARSLGAETIIAVDLKCVGSKKPWVEQEDVLYIEPYVTLGSFLLFDTKRIHRNMRLGYLDAMKKLDRYIGYIYTFPLSDRDPIKQFESGFEQFYHSISIMLGHKKIAEVYQSMLTHQLSSSLQEYQNVAHPYLRLLELCANAFEISDEEIYSFHDFIDQLFQCLESYKPVYIFDEKRSVNQIIDFIKEFSARDLIYYAYHKLSYRDEETTKLLKVLAIAKADSFLLAEMILYCKSVWK